MRFKTFLKLFSEKNMILNSTADGLYFFVVTSLLRYCI
jgi:hypothetical protein